MANPSWELSIRELFRGFWKARQDMGIHLQSYRPNGPKLLAQGVSRIRGILEQIVSISESATRQGPPSAAVSKAGVAVKMLLQHISVNAADVHTTSRIISNGGDWSAVFVEATEELDAFLADQACSSAGNGGDDNANYVSFARILRRREPGLETAKPLKAFLRRTKVPTRKPSPMRLEVHVGEFERALKNEGNAEWNALSRIERAKRRGK